MVFYFSSKSKDTVLNTLVLRTGQYHELTGMELAMFVSKPDWLLVEKYIDYVLEVTRPTTKKVIFRLPE